MKLAIGTAQFGMAYGVTNTLGQPDEKQCQSILDIAKENGIQYIDTAQAYGTSESVLGNLFASGKYNFSINTKVSLNDSANSNFRDVIKLSLSNLRVSKLDSLMLHSATELENTHIQSLLALKEQGLVNKVGLSVYSPEQTEKMSQQLRLDIVQIPLNLFDQRFCQSGTVQKLKKNGTSVHARSVFLQGLLLADYDTLPSYFKPFKSWFYALERIRKKLNAARIEMALSLAHRITDVDAFVVGVAHPKQLLEIIDAYYKSKTLDFNWSELACDEINLINPSRWKLN